MAQYKFDAERYCRSNQGRLHLPDGSDPMERIAEELQRARDLREAVAWERECDAMVRPAYKSDAFREFAETIYAARAEVDRLLEDES